MVPSGPEADLGSSAWAASISSRPRAYSAGRGGKESGIVSVLELLMESRIGSSEPKRVFDRMSGVSKDGGRR